MRPLSSASTTCAMALWCFTGEAAAASGRCATGLRIGIGSAAHLAGEMMLSMTGTSMVHVPYKGSAPAVADVIGGRVTMMMPGIGSAINLARDKPQQLTYGSSGVGSGGHLSMELLQRMARVQLIHVPYKGAGAATAAVVAGQTQFLITATGAAMPQIRGNRLRALAVTGVNRSEALPEVPTIADSGLPGYSASGWYALFGPGKMPPLLVNKIYDDVIAVIRRSDVATQIRAQGFDQNALPPNEFSHFVAKELATWGAVIKDANIRAE